MHQLDLSHHLIVHVHQNTTLFSLLLNHLDELVRVRDVSLLVNLRFRF